LRPKVRGFSARREPVAVFVAERGRRSAVYTGIEPRNWKGCAFIHNVVEERAVPARRSMLDAAVTWRLARRAWCCGRRIRTAARSANAALGFRGRGEMTKELRLLRYHPTRLRWPC
jgi:hypothetical protein